MLLLEAIQCEESQEVADELRYKILFVANDEQFEEFKNALYRYMDVNVGAEFCRYVCRTEMFEEAEEIIEDLSKSSPDLSLYIECLIKIYKASSKEDFESAKKSIDKYENKYKKNCDEKGMLKYLFAKQMKDNNAISNLIFAIEEGWAFGCAYTLMEHYYFECKYKEAYNISLKIGQYYVESGRHYFNTKHIAVRVISFGILALDKYRKTGDISDILKAKNMLNNYRDSYWHEDYDEEFDMLCREMEFLPITIS